jgi:hypothetical protein
MHSVFGVSSYRFGALLAMAAFIFSGAALGHELGQQTMSHADVRQVPAALAVLSELPPPAAGVTDLKFRELFKLPIGPRGLEPSEKLISLNGQRVRMVGYMAKEEASAAGMFILSPLPVTMGDEDESFADDLPASAVFVHMESASNAVIPYLPGLIKLTGTLQFGAQQEGDGRVSTVRLLLDPALTKEIVGNASQHKVNSAPNVTNKVVATRQMKSQHTTPKALSSQPSIQQEKQI